MQTLMGGYKKENRECETLKLISDRKEKSCIGYGYYQELSRKMMYFWCVPNSL